MGDLGDGLELGHVVARVTDAFDVDSLGLVVDGGRDVLGAVAVDELGRDAEAREEHLELVVRAAVEVRCRDDVVAVVGKRRDGHELCGLAGGGSHRSDTALESSDSLLKDIDRRAEDVSFPRHPVSTPLPRGIPPHSLHDPGVNVTKLLEPEEASAVGRVIEDEALFVPVSSFFHRDH